MDFYGMYPCTVSNQESKILLDHEKQQGDLGTEFWKKLEHHNREELDGDS